MNIHEITTAAGAHRRKRRIGRGIGSGSGKTCGRGTKGAQARAGARRYTLTEGGQMPLFRRIPKRGFSNAKFTQRYSVVNVEALQERFDPGTHVTPQAMQEAGLIRNLQLPVKVLGHGNLTKKFTVDAVKFSKTAKEKIEAVGGKAQRVQL